MNLEYVIEKDVNPLKMLQEYGQSVWLDFIQRSLLTSNELERLIKEDGLRGVTSNPAIFEKAITGSNDYTGILNKLAPKYEDPKAIYEQVAIRDIQDAADVMRPVYEETNYRDGYVSMEVSPLLARDTKGTMEEARHLWRAIGRDNIMIKVPGTKEGIPAIEQLTSEGMNINVTLLFAKDTYEKVAKTYISGLEKYVAKGGDPSKVASVASFFISRIDSAIDAQLNDRLKKSENSNEQALLKSLLGNIAIANAKLTYQLYHNIFSGPNWLALADKGAPTQRILWASTSTKNPSYRDVIYVEELIGSDTDNTIPPATLVAFREHGQLRPSLTEALEDAHKTMENLKGLGISMKNITDKLLDDGVNLFADAFEKLLNAVDKTSQTIRSAKINE